MAVVTTVVSKALATSPRRTAAVARRRSAPGAAACQGVRVAVSMQVWS